MHEDGEFPIYYASRACRGPESRLCSAEGELLAAAFGLAKFRQYLGTQPFDLVTDSRAVTYLSTTRNYSAKLARLALFLSEFNYVVQHRPGAQHRNADALTRMQREGTDGEITDSIAEILSTDLLGEEHLMDIFSCTNTTMECGP